LTDNNLKLDHENANRILEEAWILFQQKGYRGVTIDELCEHCGLSKPTLYYYFADKENLFVQVLSHKLRGFHDIIGQPGPLPERLTRIAVSILVSFQAEYSALIRDREHIKKPENTQIIREAFRSELFGPLAELMRDGVASGELVQDDPETLTLVFMGIVNNFIGKPAEMGLETQVLADRLSGYFLNGAAPAHYL
jgi:AcrR family transcriptional regulator